MPEAFIADSMIVRQLRITEKTLNRGQVASNSYESMVQSKVQSNPESRYCRNPHLYMPYDQAPCSMTMHCNLCVHQLLLWYRTDL